MADRREFLQGAIASLGASAAGLSMTGMPFAESKGSEWMGAGEFDAIRAEITKRHDESVKRLQDWIKLPSIAAENRNMSEGCELMMQMLREAGFGMV